MRRFDRDESAAIAFRCSAIDRDSRRVRAVSRGALNIACAASMISCACAVIQTDNAAEFQSDFHWHLERLEPVDVLAPACHARQNAVTSPAPVFATPRVSSTQAVFTL